MPSLALGTRERREQRGRGGSRGGEGREIMRGQIERCGLLQDHCHCGFSIFPLKRQRACQHLVLREMREKRGNWREDKR